MKHDISAIAKRLTEQSIKGFYNPFTHIEFPPSIDPASWCMSPSLISIHGSPEWESLSTEQRQRLSFFETINFFSINIHGEKALMEGLTKRLYESTDPNVTDYIHHFIDEENKHMFFFGSFCEKYAGKIYPDRKLSFPRDYAEGEEEFLFFIKVFIFEELVDFYNVQSARDELVLPVSRAINANHHEDESRHLAFGRVILNDLFQRYSPHWSSATLQGIKDYIRSYYLSTWREYYNPDIYIDMQLANPYELATRVFESDQAKAHRQLASRASLQFLKKCAIVEEDFDL